MMQDPRAAGGATDAELSPVKRALLELRAMRAQLDAAEHARAEPIAIVGIGCRYPGGANGPDRFWRLLRDGVDAIEEVPADRWDLERYFDPDPAAPGRMSTRWGGFVDGIDRFDPGFFGISPREAMAMDPQQRLLLEVAWEALEHAGQAPDRLDGVAAGVFTGISSFDYVHLAMGVPEQAIDSYLAQGIAHSAASGRLAYALGLQGPAVSVDTACSSSLVAVHLAINSLRRGECRVALAGGVNAILLPTFLIGFSKSQMMAADGRCKTFDARADGFVRGEGCGIVVLKRLGDALADRDHVWAVIRGSATNQDGRSSGMTAPNGGAQEAVIRAALADARLDPRLVGYVEAHGTGTALGDPIELQALGAALGDGRAADRPLRVGSLKTNVGHTEAAAGVASVIKAALALHHGELPPSLHFHEPNPHVAWDELPVRVATERMPFPEIDGRRVAGVSSFGFTGSNVHLVMEQAPPIEEPSPAGNGTASRSTQHSTFAIPHSAAQRPPRLLKLSARDDEALDRLVERWIDFLDQPAASWADISFTALTGRADLPARLALPAASAAEARARLQAHLRGDEVPELQRGSGASAAEVAFLFSGHGAQYPGMTRALWETQTAFRTALQECDALLRRELAAAPADTAADPDHPLLAALFPDPALPAEESPLLTGMTLSQPALFAVEWALARLWRAWGVEPGAVLGHSVGEYAAACVAGALSLEDGMRLVAARGRLMDAVGRRGAMLAVFASAEAAEALVRPHAGRVAVAAINGPAEIVLSGEAQAIDGIEAELAATGTEFRRLAVAQAGHSHLLDPILDEFEAVAATVRAMPPRVPLVSCTTGRAVSAAEIADPRYWRRHLRQTVRFADGVRTLLDDGFRVFLEVGPHAALAGIGGRCAPDVDAAWLASQRRDADGTQQILETLAGLYVRGVRVDWDGFERDQLEPGAVPRRRVPLPTNPWRHRRYWLEHAAEPGAARQTEPPEQAWSGVLEAGRRQEAQGPLDLALPAFPARWRALSELTTAMIATTVRELGGFADDRPYSVDEVMGACEILPRYRRLVERWLDRLARVGWLRRDGDGFAATAAFADAAIEPAWRDAAPALEGWAFMEEYLRRCGELLPAVITGRANPLETIFPEGSFELADQLYRDSILPRYYNAVAGAVVERFAASSGGRPLRLLEVGGGTGGTTATLVPIVERTGGAYHFTDVSELFLARAAERFAAFGCARFGLLDIDRDPAEQGFGAGAFDVIAAANVVHAVADIPATLERLRGLLTPGGILLLVEVTDYLDWFDVSTALLEGWDRQGDALRREHPMLAADAWLAALREAGFVKAAAFPGDGSPATVMAQHVVVAQAPAGEGASAATDEPGTAARRAPDRQAVREAEAAAFAERLAAAAPHEREELLVGYVREQIAALLRIDHPGSIDRRGRLMELGLDSLMAVELRSRLGRGLTLREPLPATLVFDFPTVDAVVGLLQRLLEPAAAADDAEARDAAARDGGGVAGRRIAVPAVAGGSTVAATDDDLDALSDEEVEARLLARLQSLEEDGG